MRPLKLEKISILLLVVTLAFHLSCAHNSGSLTPPPSEEVKNQKEAMAESPGQNPAPEVRKGPVTRCFKGAGIVLSYYFKAEAYRNLIDIINAFAVLPVTPFVGCAVGILDADALEEK